MADIEEIEIMSKRLLKSARQNSYKTTYYSSPYEMEYIARQLLSFCAGYKALDHKALFDMARKEYLENNP